MPSIDERIEALCEATNPRQESEAAANLRVDALTVVYMEGFGWPLGVARERALADIIGASEVGSLLLDPEGDEPIEERSGEE